MSGTNPILSKLSSGQTFPVTLANGQAIVSSIINLASDTANITDNLQSQIDALSSNVQGDSSELLNTLYSEISRAKNAEAVLRT